MSMVLILMGSDSDWNVMKKAAKLLKEFDVDFECRVSSAHRTPERTIDIISSFKGSCIIVGAGAAAHLAGVVAAHTVKPVIAVPVNSTSLNGLDALYSTVMMPSGIPVATMSIDGSKNAALMALTIIALIDDNVREKLEIFRKKMVEEVNKKDLNLQDIIKEI